MISLKAHSSKNMHILPLLKNN